MISALLVFAIALVLLGLLVLTFEIWMFVDLIKNKKLRDNEKVLWGVGMLFLHPIIAIIYYFVASNARVR